MSPTPRASAATPLVGHRRRLHRLAKERCYDGHLALLPLPFQGRDVLTEQREKRAPLELIGLLRGLRN